MKKSTIFIIVGVILAVGVVGAGIVVAGGLFLKNKVTSVLKSDEAQTLVKDMNDLKDSVEGNDSNDTSSDNQSSTSGLKKACEYYSKEEAESILGEKVTENETSDANKDGTTCMYATDLSTGKFAITSFVIADTKNTTKQSFAAAKALMNNEEKNKVKDVTVSGADEAFWVETVYQLNVLKDGKWFIFSTYTGSDVAKYQGYTIKQAEMILKKF